MKMEQDVPKRRYKTFRPRGNNPKERIKKAGVTFISKLGQYVANKFTNLSANSHRTIHRRMRTFSEFMYRGCTATKYKLQYIWAYFSLVRPTFKFMTQNET